MTSLQNLFVAKLPRNLTDADLNQVFADYNPVSAKIMLDATTGKSKGFGFVLFNSEDAGRVAYEALNKTHITIHGHNFNLSIFPSKHDGKIATEASNALYIRNIPRSLTQLAVEEFLKKFGSLTYCAMREDHYGANVWVVYAEYETVEDAKKVLTTLHGNKTFFHSTAAILAKYADSDEAKRERRRRREQQHQHHQSQGINGTQYGGHGSNGAVQTSMTGPYMAHQHQHYPQGGSTSLGAAPGTTTGSIFPIPPHHQMQPPPPPPMHAQSPQCNAAAAASPPLADPFLRVNFPQCAATIPSMVSYSSHGGLNSLDHLSSGPGTPGTPLSFSFSTEMELHSGTMSGPFFATAGGNSPAAPSTPRSRDRGNLSRSGTYRHNPYAPLTPVSSVAESSSPNSPVGMPLAPGWTSGTSPNTNLAPALPRQTSFSNVNLSANPVPTTVVTHFGRGRPTSGAATPTAGTTTFTKNHFSTTGGNGFLTAAPLGGSP